MTDELGKGNDPLADRLRAGRPTLRSGRRQELREHLARFPQLPSRPSHLWLLVLIFALAGLALLGFAASQI